MDIRGTNYLVTIYRHAQVVRLTKADGTAYDCCHTPHGLTCDCADFIYRRREEDGSLCKHLQAVVKEGVLQ